MGGKRFVADAESLDRARPHAFDDHVAAEGEVEQQLTPAVQREIERHALLVGIEVEVKGGAFGPVEVLVLARDGPGRLDPDDLGAVVGEHPGAERPGDTVGQLQYPDTVEGQLGHSWTP